MDASSLRAMTRPALQKLAKENSVKANLKSDVIIELLLARQGEKLPFPQAAKNKPSSASSQTTSNATAKKIMVLSAALHRSLAPKNSANPNDLVSATVNGSDYPHNVLANSPPQLREYESSDLENMELQYPSSPAYTFGTPESSMPGTPEPEASPEVLEDVVRTMALIDEKDRKTLDHIAKLRDITSQLHGGVEALRTGIRAERGRRQRIEKYLAYWRTIQPGWSYADIWDGFIRVYRDETYEFEVTSTDDERMEFENQQYEEELRKAGKLPPPESGLVAGDIIATMPTNTRSALSRDFPVHKAGTSPLLGSPEVQQRSKRLQDGDTQYREEKARHQHRARSGNPETHLPSQSGVLEPLAELPSALINGGALEISMQPDAAENKKGGKRSRENAENVDDTVRYRSRPRLEVCSSSGEPVPAFPRTQAHIDKGKGKMTPAQVEILLRENHGKWQLYAENYPDDSQAMPTDLRGTQKKRDRALAMVTPAEEYSVSPVAAKPTAFPPVSSPPRPTR